MGAKVDSREAVDIMNMGYHQIGSLSIAMVVYEEKQLPVEALRSLIQNVPDKIDFEVLVGFTGQCTETKKCTHDFLSKQNIIFRTFTLAQNNIGEARAKLVLESKYPWIYFTDPDCAQTISNLKVLVEGIGNNRINHLAGYGGTNRAPEGVCKYWDIINIGLNLPAGHFYSSQNWAPEMPCEVAHLSTANTILNRNAVIAVGNFSSKFSQNGEDVDLGLRLRKSGYVLMLDGRAKVLHHLPVTPIKWAKKIFSYGTGQIHIAKNNVNILSTHKLVPLFSLLIFSLLMFVNLPWATFLFLIYFLYVLLSVATQTKNVLSVSANLFLTHGAYSFGQLVGLLKIIQQVLRLKIL